MTDFLAWLHPIWQGVALAVTLATLSQGLAIRRARMRESAESRSRSRRRHIPLGIAALALMAVGWALGPVASVFAREMPAFGTAHAWTGTAAVVLIALGARYGWRLRRASAGRDELRELHVFTVGLGLFLALVEVVMGFPLLP